MNPGRAFNCYWEMPFRKRARITIENRDPDDHGIVYYQINYSADRGAGGRGLLPRPVPPHQPAARSRRTTRSSTACTGRGHYVGTYMAWGVNNAGWWGEGEIKFFMDGDDEFPTICGTGTEDYFCGAYNFDGGVVDDTHGEPLPRVHHALRRACRRCSAPTAPTARSSASACIAGTSPTRSASRSDLRVTIQALGWRTEKQDRRYLPLQDDIASVAFWYQTLPAAPFPALPDRDYLEVI